MSYESAERRRDGLRPSGKVLTALAAAALLTVGCLVSLGETDGSDADPVADGGILYRIYAGEATAYTYYGSPVSLSILPSVTCCDTVYAVTSIGYNAFSGCTSLTSVDIPDSVTSVESSAFEGCTSLTSVDIPDSVTGIGNFAFSGCTSLESINVDGDNTVYSSEDGVLFDKTKTELIQYPSGKTDPSYTIPSSVESIRSYAFSGCAFLTSVTIPDSVTLIGWSAFSGCTSLESATVPGSVTVVRDNMFRGCTSLESVTLSDGVKRIGTGVFEGCTSLESVTIPGGNGVSVRREAFIDCTSLETIRITGGTDVVFEESSIVFTDGAEHTVYVAAPEGFVIPDYAVYGNVKIIYGEKPSGSDGFPAVPAAVGVIAMLMLVGEAAAVRRGRN